MTEAMLETFLDQVSDPVIVREFIQILAAVLLAAVVLGVVYVQDLDFEQEVITTSDRGLVRSAGSVQKRVIEPSVALS